MSNLVVRLEEANEVVVFGGKAVNLGKLMNMKLPVPMGFAIGLEAFSESGKLKEKAKSQLEALIRLGQVYAVRSSATTEDAEDASWAGQFESFLNIKSKDLVEKIEECHNSAKERAVAYANSQSQMTDFRIAVVVQEMIKPEYAGVLFTQDPLTGESKFVCEYISGLGEDLVSGKADPKRLEWREGAAAKAPFDTERLTELAIQAEAGFEQPQDIEWAYADNKVWLVQARPITVTQKKTDSYNIGEPEALFYWGPSRAVPLYMSDFMAAVQTFFENASHNIHFPNPPKTLVLFHEKKMVWLSNANDFINFTEECFREYLKQNRFEEDLKKWQESAKSLNVLGTDAKDLVEAWQHTLFAEFSLYGAEPVINKLLERFDEKTKQIIWGKFTFPDKPTFLNVIDKELYDSSDALSMAERYPWIEDGYSGVNGGAKEYFQKRLQIVRENPPAELETPDRQNLIVKYELSKDEVQALTLARRLAEFMDDRKAWMMQSRRLIRSAALTIKHGWFFHEGEVELLSLAATTELWQRYIDFKSSSAAVSGVVASNGGRHFVKGEVRVVLGPTDSVENDMVIVVPATSPSYVPLMRKARALITDHGGMMSHAAIVGREFNLPCIVGTKQATKVLKDGDQVVLDMVKGEVIR